MLYDLIADFYEKSSDCHPKYIVLMGTYNENTFDEMKILGFQEDSDSNASFQDYVMDGADENFLQEYTKDGYQSEMLDVLYSDVNYEKIQVQALADEALDDEGRHTPLGVVMGDMFVYFTESDPMTPVWFVKLNLELPLDPIPVFQIPMRTVNKIILSGNRLAINVKLNDLHHNLQRGKVSYEAAVASNDAAKIKELKRINAKHEKALEMIKNADYEQ